MALNVKAIAHLATLVKDHYSNCLRVIAESWELRRRVNAIEENTLRAVSSAGQLQAKVSATTGTGRLWWRSAKSLV